MIYILRVKCPKLGCYQNSSLNVNFNAVIHKVYFCFWFNIGSLLGFFTLDSDGEYINWVTVTVFLYVTVSVIYAIINQVKCSENYKTCTVIFRDDVTKS